MRFSESIIFAFIYDSQNWSQVHSQIIKLTVGTAADCTIHHNHSCQSFNQSQAQPQTIKSAVLAVISHNTGTKKIFSFLRVLVYGVQIKGAQLQ